ncbi:MAG: hypothetical protein WC162_04340 [Sphaerochaetaceae bacterium]
MDIRETTGAGYLVAVVVGCFLLGLNSKGFRETSFYYYGHRNNGDKNRYPFQRVYR